MFFCHNNGSGWCWQLVAQYRNAIGANHLKILRVSLIPCETTRTQMLNFASETKK